MRYSAESFWGKVLPAVSGGTTGQRFHTSRRRAAGRSFRQSRQGREEQCSLCVKRRCSKSVRCVAADNVPQKTTENLTTPCKAKPRTELSGVLCVLCVIVCIGKEPSVDKSAYGFCRVPRRGAACPPCAPKGGGRRQTCVPPRYEKGKAPAACRVWESEKREKAPCY